MAGIGELLNGIGVFVVAVIAVYNLLRARDRDHKIATLEKNTNSIKDALVKVTGEAERAKGIIEGRNEANAKL